MSGGIWFASRTRNRHFQDASRRDEGEGRDCSTATSLEIGHLGFLSFSQSPPKNKPFIVVLNDVEGFLHALGDCLFNNIHELTWIQSRWLREKLSPYPARLDKFDEFYGKDFIVNIHEINVLLPTFDREERSKNPSKGWGVDEQKVIILAANSKPSKRKR